MLTAMITVMYVQLFMTQHKSSSPVSMFNAFSFLPRHHIITLIYYSIIFQFFLFHLCSTLILFTIRSFIPNKAQENTDFSLQTIHNYQFLQIIPPTTRSVVLHLLHPRIPSKINLSTSLQKQYQRMRPKTMLDYPSILPVGQLRLYQFHNTSKATSIYNNQKY